MNTDIVSEKSEDESIVHAKVSRYLPVLEAILLMCVLHAIRGILLLIVSPLFLSTSFTKKMLTMGIMLLLTPLVLFYSKRKKTDLRIMPEEFSKGYKIFTVAAIIMLIANPSNYTVGITAILESIYACVVTPVFEETIFRGYIWRRFETLGIGKKGVFWWNAVLFCLWHLGYSMTNVFVGNMLAVVGKLAVGFVYGIILCIVRKRSGNVYSCILVHGILNLFMP